MWIFLIRDSRVLQLIAQIVELGMRPSRRLHRVRVSLGHCVLLRSRSTRCESGHERFMAIEIDPTQHSSCCQAQRLPWLDDDHENGDAANQVCKTSDPWTDMTLWNISNGYLYHVHGEPQVYNSQEKTALQQRWSMTLQYMHDRQPALQRPNATDPEEVPQCILNHIMCLAWAVRGECEENHRTNLAASALSLVLCDALIVRFAIVESRFKNQDT
jgi:hypothetical protein